MSYIVLIASFGIGFVLGSFVARFGWAKLREDVVSEVKKLRAEVAGNKVPPPAPPQS